MVDEVFLIKDMIDEVFLIKDLIDAAVSPVPEGDDHRRLAAVERPALPPEYLQEQNLLHQPRLLEGSLDLRLENIFDEVNIVIGHLLLNPVGFNSMNQECSLLPEEDQQYSQYLFLTYRHPCPPLPPHLPHGCALLHGPPGSQTWT